MTSRFHTSALGFALAGSVLALCAASGPAAAAPDGHQPADVHVRYADLDLHQEAGARIMYQRIRAAAEAACGGRSDLGILGRRLVFDRCRDAAIGQALDQLRAPLVTAAAGRFTPALVAGR